MFPEMQQYQKDYRMSCMPLTKAAEFVGLKEPPPFTVANAQRRGASAHSARLSLYRAAARTHAWTTRCWRRADREKLAGHLSMGDLIKLDYATTARALPGRGVDQSAAHASNPAGARRCCRALGLSLSEVSPTPPCFLWRPETALCSTQGADVMCGMAVDLLVLAWCSRSKLRCTLYVTEVLRQLGPRGLSHTLVR